MAVFRLVLFQLLEVLLPMLLSTSGKGETNAFEGQDLLLGERRLLRVGLALLVVLAKLLGPLVELPVLVRGLDVDMAGVGSVELGKKRG